MSNRNQNRDVLINDTREYIDFLRKRGLQSVKQYGKMPIYETETYERAALQVVKHIVESGDRMYKLAFEHYGDVSLWWLIAWYNKKPTDFHMKPGQIIEIPLPLKEVLYLANKEE